MQNQFIYPESDDLPGATCPYSTGEKTWQSEVERAHGLIESELLGYEQWETLEELKGKTTAWEYYFNRLRKNTYHQKQTSCQRMKRAGIQSKTAENVCLWTVTILDELGKNKINNVNYKSVNHVYPSVNTPIKTIANS